MSGSESKKPKFDPNYFELPALSTLIINIPLVGFHVVVCFFPDIFPEYLWPIPSAVQWWEQNLRLLSLAALYVVAISHTLEALYGLKLCRDFGMTTSATIKWILVILYCGLFALNGKLRPYLKKFKQD